MAKHLVYSFLRDLDNNLANMFLRLEIRESVDGLLEWEHLVYYWSRHFGMRTNQTVH